MLAGWHHTQAPRLLRPVLAAQPTVAVVVMSSHFWKGHDVEELKSAGAPIEGTLRLRPSHGKVGRVKTSIEKGHFAYFWISDEHWALIQGGLKDDGWKDWVQ